MPSLSARIALLGASILTFALSPAYAETHKAWDYPPFGASDDALKQAFQNSCSKFQGMNPRQYLHSNKLFGTAGQWQSICEDGLKRSPADLKEFFKNRLMKVSLPGGPGKFTGYYRPVLEGSRTRSSVYKYPVVAKPADLVVCNGKTGQKLPQPDEKGRTCRESYPTRGEIEKNISRYKPIVWLKDPVSAFFMHIQGSGVVELPSGETIRLGFAGKNGHPYVAIGKVLKERGAISAPITADKIRAWLKAHPAEADNVLHANPSFIFFYESKTETTGALGVPLTAGRSVAVDKDTTPLGVPVFIETTNTHDNTVWNRMMFAHDVGSAIQGANRADIYFGQGDEAGDRAGDQNAPGQMFAMVPKENLAIAQREPAKNQNVTEVSSDLPVYRALAQSLQLAAKEEAQTPEPEAQLLADTNGTAFLIRQPARVEPKASTSPIQPLSQQEIEELQTASLPPVGQFPEAAPSSTGATEISSEAAIEPAAGPATTQESPANATPSPPSFFESLASKIHQPDPLATN